MARHSDLMEKSLQICVRLDFISCFLGASMSERVEGELPSMAKQLRLLLVSQNVLRISFSSSQGFITSKDIQSRLYTQLTSYSRLLSSWTGFFDLGSSSERCSQGHPRWTTGTRTWGSHNEIRQGICIVSGFNVDPRCSIPIIDLQICCRNYQLPSSTSSCGRQ